MNGTSVFGFEWDFLDEVAWWAIGVAVIAAIVGTLVTHDAAFASGCLLAAGVDIALVLSASRSARRALESHRVDDVAPMVMLAGRVVVKAALLVLAMVVPHVMGFAGTVAGVLLFDITLALVGSAIALVRSTRRRPGEGG